MFADDCLLYLSNKSILINQVLVNIDLKNFKNFVNENKLMININKKKYIIIAKRNVNVDAVTLMIDDNEIEKVAQIKYLGIIIDDKLNFNSNASLICKKNCRF